MENKLKNVAINITGELEKKVRNLDRTLALTVFVLLVGFLTMIVAMFSVFIDSNGSKSASYQQLESQVQAENAQIQVLTNQLRNSTVTPR